MLVIKKPRPANGNVLPYGHESHVMAYFARLYIDPFKNLTPDITVQRENTTKQR